MEVKLPGHKTKIVCTIGPASRSEPVLEELIRRGMNVARLNFAHGTVDGHRKDIRCIRSAAAKLERSCLILADLPGPKIRIGKLKSEPLLLKKGDKVTLTTKDVPCTAEHISVNYRRLPESVSRGSVIYLNDGFIQLEVEGSAADEVVCKVVIGGPLLSHKGLNLPGAKIFTDTVTDRDLQFVDFALKEGIDTFGVSFVEKADDILKVRDFARERGRAVHVVAKIERAEAVQNIDEILDAADAIMIARGDLGVQIPVEDVPAAQKKLIRKANLLSRPVITATQMLLSMTENIRPTRAETSDVANAILDGTDAVMLSEETAIGRYPVEAVDMISKIAVSIERNRQSIEELSDLREYFKSRLGGPEANVDDVVSFNVVESARALPVPFIIASTKKGDEPRKLSRFKPDCWVLAFSDDEKIRRFMDLSYGVLPVIIGENTDNSLEGILGLVIESKLVSEKTLVIATGEFPADNIADEHSFRIIRANLYKGGS